MPTSTLRQDKEEEESGDGVADEQGESQASKEDAVEGGGVKV